MPRFLSFVSEWIRLSTNLKGRAGTVFKIVYGIVCLGLIAIPPEMPMKIFIAYGSVAYTPDTGRTIGVSLVLMYLLVTAGMASVRR